MIGQCFVLANRMKFKLLKNKTPILCIHNTNYSINQSYKRQKMANQTCMDPNIQMQMINK